MGAPTTPTPDGQDGADERRMERETRRYGRIIARLLPAWAPAPIVSRLHDALEMYRFARRDARRNPDDPSLADEKWFACLIADSVRLCTYCPEMQGVWSTLATTPVRGQRRAGWTANGKISQVLFGIDVAQVRFARAPRSAPATRRKSLTRVVLAARRLLDAVEASPEAAELLGLALARHTAPGRPESPLLRRVLATTGHADAQTVGGVLGDGTVAPWQSSLMLHALPSGRSASPSLADMLQPAIEAVVLAARAVPVVAAPGRPDRGRQPFLIRQLSTMMRDIYGKPLDDIVALLVSAITDLPQPLTRDDIRPYLKHTGKKLSKTG